MGRLSGLLFLLVMALFFSGCATGEPRLQGTWKSHKVPMPTEMVKETKMETVRIRKGSRKTKQVPRTVMVAKTKAAPPYINLTIRYEGASIIMDIPAGDGQPAMRRKIPYKVASSDANSVALALAQPGTSTADIIQIVFEGPDRYWVNPAQGEGWKEYYDRVK